ncbi:MAG: fasciclin domain-containing protein [Pontixanthobacter sp.]
MRFLALPVLASALALAACGEPAEDTDTVADETAVSDVATDEGTVVEIAQGNPDFSTLVEAITSAELGETLSGAGPFTVFAPTNAAFDKLPDGTLDDLMMEENREDFQGLLTYHVVPGETNAATLMDAIKANDGSYELTTVNGATLTASMDGDNVILTDAAGGTSTITATDVEASNGIIHAIDTVVMPG